MVEADGSRKVIHIECLDFRIPAKKSKTNALLASRGLLGGS